MQDFQSFVSRNESKARTVSGAFEQFLDQQINIAKGTRGTASGSQNALRDYLAGLASTDECFPRVLSINDSDFLGGSYARHTKIWPLDDIDVYLPLDATGLVYSSGGVPYPNYAAVSDNVLEENPLLKDRDRWMRGDSISPDKVVEEFRKVLRERYPATTRVRSAGQAIQITLSNGLGFDVVPCFSIRPQWSLYQPFYLIPDENDRWIHTNPRLDQDMSDELHRENNKTLRKAVKLLKWYNGEHLGGRIASYYAELAIMRAFEAENLTRRIFKISEAVRVGFKAVGDAFAKGSLMPLLGQAPVVEPGDVTQEDIARFSEDIINCTVACSYEIAGDVEKALSFWREVFGEKFPSA